MAALASADLFYYYYYYYYGCQQATRSERAKSSRDTKGRRRHLSQNMIRNLSPNGIGPLLFIPLDRRRETPCHVDSPDQVDTDSAQVIRVSLSPSPSLPGVDVWTRSDGDYIMVGRKVRIFNIISVELDSHPPVQWWGTVASLFVFGWCELPHPFVTATLIPLRINLNQRTDGIWIREYFIHPQPHSGWLIVPTTATTTAALHCIGRR